MKYTLILGGFALAVATINMAQADDSTDHHSKPGHQSRTTGQQANADAKASTDGKRLPGRDCKFYEGGTKQHSWPQYEVGNVDRPECPESAE